MKEKLVYYFRWLFKRCIDCNVKLPKQYSRGDACDKCFAGFNGLEVIDMINGGFIIKEKDDTP